MILKLRFVLLTLFLVAFSLQSVFGNVSGQQRADFESGNWQNIDPAVIDELIESEDPIILSSGFSTNINGYLANVGALDEDEQERRLQQVSEYVRNNLEVFAEILGTDQGYSNLESSFDSGEDCEAGFRNLFCIFNREADLRSEFMDQYNAQLYSIIQDDTLSIEERNMRMEEVTLNYVASLVGLNNIDCSVGLDSCENQINQFLSEQSSTCESGAEGEACRSRVALARQIMNERNEHELIRTNVFYEIIAGLLQPDQIATNAAKLFGFEADYSSLPQVLRDDFGSQMCIAKIEGYLDKDLPNNGGVTRYDVTNTSSEIVVRADLRAQRTIITPNNKTSITYSYFLRGAPDFATQYILAVSYSQDGETMKKAIIEKTNLSESGTTSGFDNILLDLNMTEGIDEGSFTISLLAVKSGTTNVYLELSYPIVLITSGDYYNRAEGPSNDVGHGQATHADGSGELTTDDLLGLLGG